MPVLTMIPFAFPFASDPRKDIDGDARDGEGGEDGEDAPLLSLCKADSPLRVLHMQQMSHSKWFKRHQFCQEETQSEQLCNCRPAAYCLNDI